MYVFIPIKGTKRENIFFFFPRGKGKFRDEEEEGLIEEKTKIDPYPIPDIEKQNFTKLYIRNIVSRAMCRLVEAALAPPPFVPCPLIDFPRFDRAKEASKKRTDPRR